MGLHLDRSCVAFILGNEVRDQMLPWNLPILRWGGKLGDEEIRSSSGESTRYDHGLWMGDHFVRSI
jgi:hypothetical protein